MACFSLWFVLGLLGFAWGEEAQGPSRSFGQSFDLYSPPPPSPESLRQFPSRANVHMMEEVANIVQIGRTMRDTVTVNCHDAATNFHACIDDQLALAGRSTLFLESVYMSFVGGVRRTSLGTAFAVDTDIRATAQHNVYECVNVLPGAAAVRMDCALLATANHFRLSEIFLSTDSTRVDHYSLRARDVIFRDPRTDVALLRDTVRPTREFIVPTGVAGQCPSDNVIVVGFTSANSGLWDPMGGVWTPVDLASLGFPPRHVASVGTTLTGIDADEFVINNYRHVHGTLAGLRHPFHLEHLFGDVRHTASITPCMSGGPGLCHTRESVARFVQSQNDHGHVQMAAPNLGVEFMALDAAGRALLPTFGVKDIDHTNGYRLTVAVGGGTVNVTLHTYANHVPRAVDLFDDICNDLTALATTAVRADGTTDPGVLSLFKSSPTALDLGHGRNAEFQALPAGVGVLPVVHRGLVAVSEDEWSISLTHWLAPTDATHVVIGEVSIASLPTLATIAAQPTATVLACATL